MLTLTHRIASLEAAAKAILREIDALKKDVRERCPDEQKKTPPREGEGVEFDGRF